MAFIRNILNTLKRESPTEPIPTPRPAFVVRYTERISACVYRVITQSTKDGSITDQNVLVLPQDLYQSESKGEPE